MLTAGLSILHSDHHISKPTYSAANDHFSQTQTTYREQHDYRNQNREIKWTQTTTNEIKEEVKASKVEKRGNWRGMLNRALLTATTTPCRYLRNWWMLPSGGLPRSRDITSRNGILSWTRHLIWSWHFHLTH